MSEHFRPETEVRTPVSRRERRRLRRMFAPAPRRSSVSNTTVAIVIAAAVCAGLAAGLGGSEVRTVAATPGPDKPILWNETQAVPRADESPDDAAWASRSRVSSGAGLSDDGLIGDGSGGGAFRAAGSARMTTIPFFGFCHVGGGRNCVVDGDTFYQGGAKIRIANIDAPETHPPRCAEEARLGKAATDRLRDLLNAGDVSLSRSDRDEDSYGRKLRTVAVGGADVGETLVGEGLARPYRGGRQPWC